MAIVLTQEAFDKTYNREYFENIQGISFEGDVPFEQYEKSDITTLEGAIAKSSVRNVLPILDWFETARKNKVKVDPETALTLLRKAGYPSYNDMNKASISGGVLDRAQTDKQYTPLNNLEIGGLHALSLITNEIAGVGMHVRCWGGYEYDPFGDYRKEMKQLEKNQNRAEAIKTPLGKELHNLELTNDLSIAIHDSSFADVRPIISWFENLETHYESRRKLYMENQDQEHMFKLFNFNLDSQSIEQKFKEAGYPSYEEWHAQTTAEWNGPMPELEERFAHLNQTQLWGIELVADIQLSCRGNTYISSLGISLENYKNHMKNEDAQKGPTRIQKGHAKDPKITPDTSRGDRTDG